MKKLLIIGLLILTIAAFLEIAFYFVYIFKPLERLTGQDLGTPKGIPTASDIFTPMILNPYIKQADESKKYYFQRLDGFTSEVNGLMASKSSFIKAVEADYVVAGYVESINPLQGEQADRPDGYDITLTNSTDEKHTEHINSSETLYIKVFSVIISTDSFSRKASSFSEIQQGDYVVIKRSTNLLNPSETTTEVDILTTLE